MTNVGVTGHRFLADLEQVEAGVQQALAAISAARPDGDLVVVSALAEGADQIVARVALGRQRSRLIVVLPLAREEYLTDFVSQSSKAEFLDLLARAVEIVEVGPAATRVAAYEAGGLAMLDRSDVLLTIWDGQDAQGRGGTGQIVNEARRRGLPIAWVHAGNRRPGTSQPTSLGADQGSVTLERLGA